MVIGEWIIPQGLDDAVVQVWAPDVLKVVRERERGFVEHRAAAHLSMVCPDPDNHP